MTTTPVEFERRAAQRFGFHLPVTVRLTGGAAEHPGLTQDVSARGVFFYTDFSLQPGIDVEVTLVMPSEITLSQSMRVRCQGKVLRVVQPTVGSKFGVAVHLERYEYLPDVPASSGEQRRASDFPTTGEDELRSAIRQG